MCRQIHGRLNLGGEILSGSNGDDPALDFSCEKTERGVEIEYKTPYNAIPSLALTPEYGESPTNYSGLERPRGNLILVSNESKGFKLELVSESGSLNPQRFSFIAIG